MMTCKEYSKLLSESMEHQLPLGQRAAVFLHGAMCTPCKGYKRTLAMVRQVSRELADDEGASLSEEARERIRKALADLT
ncbi:MAG: zf-HC2 domain-containing protein [Deltaproteobacteria bacterium]|nr:zf-HC2 domain-containing protein [Deltaproteobacteria bacterium]